VLSNINTSPLLLLPQLADLELEDNIDLPEHAPWDRCLTLISKQQTKQMMAYASRGMRAKHPWDIAVHSGE